MAHYPHRGILKHQFYSYQFKVKTWACVNGQGLSQVGRACYADNVCILMFCTAEAHSHMQRHAQLRLLLEQVRPFNHHTRRPQGIQATRFSLCFNVRFEAPVRENGGMHRALAVQSRGGASPPPFILPGRVPGLAVMGRLGSDIFTNPHSLLPTSGRDHGAVPRRAVVQTYSRCFLVCFQTTRTWRLFTLYSFSSIFPVAHKTIRSSVPTFFHAFQEMLQETQTHPRAYNCVQRSSAI